MAVNADAFSRLYAAYSHALYNYALWMMRNRQTAEDVIQSVFAKVWQLGGVPTVPDETEWWLYGVTRNRCLDSLRTGSRQRRLRERYGAEWDAAEPRGNDASEIWEVLDKLDEEDRTVLYLHFKAECSYREIAAVLQSSEGAARVKAFRAIERLRSLVAKE
jgi:RNA polymerase sigma-70 factor, ECF subfamily